MRSRRLISLAVIAMSAALLSATPVQGQTLPTSGETISQVAGQLRDERRGLVFDGLRQRLGGPCGNAFEVVESFELVAAIERYTNGRVRCTHGPDPAPDGVDVRVHREFPAAAAPAPAPAGAVALSQPGIPCYGTGSDGYRVQLLYVRRSGTTDKSATLFPNFVTWAASANATYRDSAAKTGGVRNIRFVTDAGCNLVIQKVTVSADAISNFSTFVSELKRQGLTRSDRKYLSWVDGNSYCGIGEIYIDDKANTTPGLSTSNYNNGHPGVKGAFARVDNGCWGQSSPVEAHELTHMLGGVQATAPNATPGYHCRDESDRMCYADGGGVNMVQRCSSSQERLLDCNGDDYFNTSPAGASWLASHWNVANSAFLATTDSGAPPPPTTTTTAPTTTTSTTVPPTTTTTTVPPTTTTTTTTSTTQPPPSSTTTTPTTAPTTTTPPTTAAPPTTVSPPTTAAGAPSAPRSLIATRAPIGPGVRLIWQPPATGTVTGYNLYRRTGSGPLTKVADVPKTSYYTDTTTSPGVTYTYSLSAENGAAEGPRSNEVTAVAA